MLDGLNQEGPGLAADAVRDGAGERPCLWVPGRNVDLILIKRGNQCRVMWEQGRDTVGLCGLPWLLPRRWTVRG